MTCRCRGLAIRSDSGVVCLQDIGDDDCSREAVAVPYGSMVVILLVLVVVVVVKKDLNLCCCCGIRIYVRAACATLC